MERSTCGQHPHTAPADRRPLKPDKLMRQGGGIISGLFPAVELLNGNLERAILQKNRTLMTGARVICVLVGSELSLQGTFKGLAILSAFPKESQPRQMQKAEVSNGVEFAYRDSGAPASEDYFTVVVIHGHTYHSGTFSRMLEKANSLGHRLIVPNRRLYPGSTPYTEEETQAFESTNSTDDITKALLKQGEYLLLFVNNVIEKHGLKKVILAGWSLGTTFLSGAVYAITIVNKDVSTRLVKAVKAIVWWDPPATALGIPPPPSGDWIPLYDETLDPDHRGQAFGEWLVQYYPHPDVHKKDCYNLIYKITSPVKPPTFSDTPAEEFLAKVDLTAGSKGDNHIADRHFQAVVKKVKELAFFDLSVRNAWKDVPFSVMYGEESTYNVLWAAWQLEAEAESTGLQIRFKSMPGANHFPMHDLPEHSFEVLYACL